MARHDASALHDRDRLQALIDRHGIAGTARVIGRSPSTVRDRARALGIPPGRAGRRRGATFTAVTAHPSVEARVLAQISTDRRRRTPAIDRMLADRFRAVSAATVAHEPAARHHALIDLGALCCLIVEHEEAL